MSDGTLSQAEINVLLGEGNKNKKAMENPMGLGGSLFGDEKERQDAYDTLFGKKEYNDQAARGFGDLNSMFSGVKEIFDDLIAKQEQKDKVQKDKDDFNGIITGIKESILTCNRYTKQLGIYLKDNKNDMAIDLYSAISDIKDKLMAIIINADEILMDNK